MRATVREAVGQILEELATVLEATRVGSPRYRATPAGAGTTPIADIYGDVVESNPCGRGDDAA